MHNLPRQQGETGVAPEYTVARRLRQLLRDVNMDEIKRRDAQGQRLALEAHLRCE